MSKKYNILFLCAKNSARSILAEVLASTLSHGRFVGYSAGSNPARFVHPIALRMARDIGYPLELLWSKSWDEFGIAGAPRMDMIITVCDSVAGEACPYWPGHPMSAHWGFADPAAVDSGEIAMVHAFQQVEMGLRSRIELLMDLPMEKLDQSLIKDELQSIHHRLKFR